MTQGKKKKRAANRSIMLAKKIIIKDGGTVSWASRRGASLGSPHPTSFCLIAATSCPFCVPPPSHSVRGDVVSVPRPRLLGGFSPGPACGLRCPFSGRSLWPLPHLPPSPPAAPGGLRPGAPRAPRSQGAIDSGSLACPPRSSPLQTRLRHMPREAVSALSKGRGSPCTSICCCPGGIWRDDSAGARSVLAFFFPVVLGQCPTHSCSQNRKHRLRLGCPLHFPETAACRRTPGPRLKSARFQNQSSPCFKITLCILKIKYTK